MVFNWHPERCINCEHAIKCETTRLCPVNQRIERPNWTNDFIAAVEVYRLAIRLSGCDFNGYPQLTLLDFAVQMSSFEVENKTTFMEYIASIHSWYIKVISEKKAV